MPPKITLKRRKRTDTSFEERQQLIHEIDSDDEEIQVIASKKTRHAACGDQIGDPPICPSKTASAREGSKKERGKSLRGEPDQATPSISSVSVVGTGIKGKMNLQKLEAMARATTKIKEEYTKAQSNEKDCLPWVDRNFPKDLEEHFVHKKKVNDLRVWLQNSLNADQCQSRICLLTGPTGSGKTATAYLLANELEMEIKEWINPMSLTQYEENRNFTDEIYGRSQTELFSDFLLRSSQYSALPVKGKKKLRNKIVVVEDIPNQFFRDTEAFHNILRNFQGCGTSPVIFIVGDNASGSNPMRLFTNGLLQELGIVQISFNSVAPTLMVKFMALVCSRENVTVQQPILEGVAAASGGDMRCAINTLQFKILQEKPVTKENGGFKRPLPRVTKVTRDKMLKSEELAHKDESLFLFRALGKVLYNKRNRSAVSTVEDQLHKDLLNQKREFSCEDDPEDIAHKVEVSTGTFIGFLSQNYVNFFTSIEEVSKAARYISDAEVLLSNWNYEDCSYGSNNFKGQDRKDQLALSIAIRGLMHSNTIPVSSRWRPLKKPLCSDVDIKNKQIVDRTRHLFPTLNSFLEGFYHEDIPFLAKITKGNVLNQDQRKLVNEVGIFKDLRNTYKPKWTETLDEKFAGDEDKCSEDDEISSTLTDSSAVYGAYNFVEIKSVDTKATVEDAFPEDFQIDEFED
ncbi:unnamed protein product [Allacma fusca]|uniref:Cell cycle checkpoint protein RAD17 n=1 Tax=Allacma fusca TaxID=39272 RepID=A0A8J2NXH2_9HEXA|nr:unnamed protein product [Allacma fusca]